MICYLIKSLAMSYPEAVEHVRKARHWIDPNSGFRTKLRQLTRSFNNEDDTNSELYEEAGAILAKMHEDHKIIKRSYTRVVKIFNDIFGSVHPYTLDIKNEMDAFL